MIDVLKPSENNIIKTKRSEELLNKMSKLGIASIFTRSHKVWSSEIYRNWAVVIRRNTGSIQIGDKTYSTPEALHGIVDHVKEAKEILDYPADWDDEGALATDEPTFNYAAQFVLEYALTAYNDHRIILTIPYIDIMRDGSVSVLWESEKARMFIIFKLEDHDLAYYYAEQKDKQIPTKSAIDISGPIDRILFSWMITYLK